MLVAALTIGVGVVCLYYGARALRVGRAVRRLRGGTGDGPDRSADHPSHPTDWPRPPGEDTREPGATFPEQGSLERGVVLLTLGACCVLFGVLAA